MNIKSELVKTFKNLLSTYFEKVWSTDELKISSLTVGGKVEIIGSDDTLTVAPDGDYVMNDGTAFSVKDGLIVSIVGQEVAQSSDEKKDEEETKDETEEKMEEHQTEVTEEPKDEMAMKVEELTNRLNSMEEKLAEVYGMLEAMKEMEMKSQDAILGFNKVVEDLNNNIKTLAEIPAQFSNVDKTAQYAEDKQTKMLDLATILTKKK